MIFWQKTFTLKTIARIYSLKETLIYEGSSFALNCSFYITKYDHIYITDYDFNNSDDLEKRGLSMLFYRNHVFFNSKTITDEILKDKKIFKCVLDQFKKDCDNLINSINLKKTLK